MRRSLRSLFASTALAAAVTGSLAGAGASARVADPAAPPVTTTTAGTLTGSWRAASGSWTGYRVITTIALSGRHTIRGRTTAVTGSAAIRRVSGRERLTSARFTADLRRATTGNALYDRQAALLLETSRYPSGVFVLAAPVTMPSASALATGRSLPLVGNLTLHGVTRRVTVPARVIGTASRFTVTGSLAIRLTDFLIPLIAVGGLARAEDAATVDFRVVFVR